jgi:hypothetical protein
MHFAYAHLHRLNPLTVLSNRVDRPLIITSKWCLDTSTPQYTFSAVFMVTPSC